MDFLFWAALGLAIGVGVAKLISLFSLPWVDRYTYETDANGNEYVKDHRDIREGELDRMQWAGGGAAND